VPGEGWLAKIESLLRETPQKAIVPGLKAESSIALANIDPSSSARFPEILFLVKSKIFLISYYYSIQYILINHVFTFPNALLILLFFAKHSFSNLAFRDLYIYSSQVGQ
jgi:hypothetical protein